MDLRQLHYFIAIVEAGSFSRASEMLHIAQPALSQHVISMEAHLGVKLLHRNPRGVVPTEAGLRLIDRAREIEARFAALVDEVRNPGKPSGEVRFGMPATINEQIGAELIEAGRKLYPDIKIRISEAMSGFVFNWLRENVVDVAMLYNVADEKGFVLHHALTEEIRLFGSTTMNPLPKGHSIALASALKLPLITPGPSHGLRELIEKAARTTKRPLDPVIEIDSYRQIKQLVVRGVAFGLLPTTAIREEEEQGLIKSWTIIKPALKRRIYLGYKAGPPLPAVTRAVGQLSWDILEKHVHSGGWTATWEGHAPLNLYP